MLRYLKFRLFLFALGSLSLVGGQAYATVNHAAVASICEAAASLASRETGVPLDVLRAISLTETGRKGPDGFLPWPWTVNMEGTGRWFDEQTNAQAYVDQNFARGARSFDVGCFQINYRWHGQAFDSIEQMFEPEANARYAAEFLQRLFDELGDWTKAAGAYHSRTPKYANKYKARFERIRARLTDLPDIVPAVVRDVAAVQPANPTSPVEIIRRINRYPLLVQGGSSSVGSLVPLAAAAPTRLIDLSGPRPILEMR